MRNHAALICAGALAAAGMPLVAQPPTGAVAQPFACAFAAGAPRELTTADGRALYVEAVAFSASGGDVLLAGTPNYVWDLEKRRADTNRWFGAVIHGRTASLIESPIEPRRVSDVRALGRGDGSWDVVFAELPAYPVDQFPPPTDSVVRLWHGVYDGRGWKSLAPIPTAPGLRVQGTRSSELVRHGDTLVWAVRAKTPERFTRVVVLERRGESWRSEIVPTTSAAYVTVAGIPGLGLALGVVGADASLRAPGTDANSLFLWRREGEWRLQRRVVLGMRDGPTSHPALFAHATRSYLTWAARSGSETTVRAESDPLGAPTPEPQVIETGYGAQKPIQTVVGPGNRPLWVSDHRTGGDASTIRFYAPSPEGSRLVHEMASPFFRGFRTAQTSPSALALVGTRMDALRRPSSLLVHVALRCGDGAPPS